jgi:hypothetical protein
MPHWCRRTVLVGYAERLKHCRHPTLPVCTVAACTHRLPQQQRRRVCNSALFSFCGRRNGACGLVSDDYGADVDGQDVLCLRMVDSGCLRRVCCVALTGSDRLFWWTLVLAARGFRSGRYVRVLTPGFSSALPLPATFCAPRYSAVPGTDGTFCWVFLSCGSSLARSTTGSAPSTFRGTFTHVGACVLATLSHFTRSARHAYPFLRSPPPPLMCTSGMAPLPSTFCTHTTPCAAFPTMACI